MKFNLLFKVVQWLNVWFYNFNKNSKIFIFVMNQIYQLQQVIVVLFQKNSGIYKSKTFYPRTLQDRQNVLSEHVTVKIGWISSITLPNFSILPSILINENLNTSNKLIVHSYLHISKIQIFKSVGSICKLIYWT